MKPSTFVYSTPKCSHTFGIFAAFGFLVSSVTTQPLRTLPRSRGPQDDFSTDFVFSRHLSDGLVVRGGIADPFPEIAFRNKKIRRKLVAEHLHPSRLTAQ